MNIFLYSHINMKTHNMMTNLSDKYFFFVDFNNL